MSDLVVWNIVLTGLVGIIGFIAKTKFEEVDRLAVLLNKTREEIARDHVTRAEMSMAVERLGQRFDKAVDRLEEKLDELRKER